MCCHQSYESWQTWHALSKNKMWNCEKKKRQHKRQPSSGHCASVKATMEMLLSPWLGGKKAQVLPKKKKKIRDSAAKLAVAQSPCHLAVVFAGIPWGSPLCCALVCGPKLVNS